MQFRPGQSGNPAGRPKKADSIAHEVDRILEIKDQEHDGKSITRKEALALAVTKLALEGNEKCMKLVFEYTAQKPVIQIANEIYGQLNVTVINPPVEFLTEKEAVEECGALEKNAAIIGTENSD